MLQIIRRCGFIIMAYLFFPDLDDSLSFLSNTTTNITDNDTPDTLLIVRSSVAASALLSCLLVLVLAAIFTFKEDDARRLPTVRIVLCITLASVIRSIIIIAQVSPVLDNSLYNNDTYCILTGYLYRNISMIAILFTLTATIHTLLITFAVNHTWKLELCYVFVPIILPLGYTWIPFVYDKALLQAWCLVSTNDTPNVNGIIYNSDVPRFIVEALNTLLIIVVFCRMPFTYRKIKCDREQFNVWLKQVLPILTHSIFYLAMNWFSLTDHLNMIFGFSSSSKRLRLAHSITSAGRGLVVGFVFTAYFLIMLYISWKYSGNTTVSSEGVISTPSSSYEGSINKSHESDKLI